MKKFHFLGFKSLICLAIALTANVVSATPGQEGVQCPSDVPGTLSDEQFNTLLSSLSPQEASAAISAYPFVRTADSVVVPDSCIAPDPTQDEIDAWIDGWYANALLEASETEPLAELEAEAKKEVDECWCRCGGYLRDLVSTMVYTLPLKPGDLQLQVNHYKNCWALNGTKCVYFSLADSIFGGSSTSTFRGCRIYIDGVGTKSP